jgi:antitoxin HicB
MPSLMRSITPPLPTPTIWVAFLPSAQRRETSTRGFRAGVIAVVFGDLDDIAISVDSPGIGIVDLGIGAKYATGALKTCKQSPVTRGSTLPSMEPVMSCSVTLWRGGFRFPHVVRSSLSYPFIIRPLEREDGGGFLIEYPDLPGCVSDGETPEEALRNGSDAVKAYLLSCAKQGEAIPKPGTASGQWRQRVPRSLPAGLVARAPAGGRQPEHTGHCDDRGGVGTEEESLGA